MNIASGVLAAALVAGIAAIAGPAHAQGVPTGSYLNNCTNVAVRGDALIATCRSADGRETRSALNGVRRCAGDIANHNGTLQCAFPDGAQVRGQVVMEPGAPRIGEQGPVYGERRAGTEGYGSEAWERCRGLRREADELRGRLGHEWNPLERGRIEGQLREVHERQERCPY